MGIFRAITDSVAGTLSDQWKDIYTAGPFDEHVVVSPGVLKNKNNGRGANVHGSEGVITRGSLIFVPENTAAYIFGEGGIDEVILAPGTYEYEGGEDSVFSNGSVDAVFDQVTTRIGFGGIPGQEKRVAFVNLREIRGIPFGTRGPQMYNDRYYRCDLEVFAFGTFSIQVTDPDAFVRNFVPPNTYSYSIDNPSARKQVISEFLQSFITALNSLSSEFRISQLPGQAQAISDRIAEDDLYVGSWPERFGFRVVRVAIENIEFSPESRELVHGFNQNRMSVSAFEDTSQQAANTAAQQKIAQGVQTHGFGDAGGMLFGMKVASAISPGGQIASPAPADQQVAASANPAKAVDYSESIETVRKLKELLDTGVLTQEEFDAKKRELLGL